jgi:putative NADPH-quinone reductase
MNYLIIYAHPYDKSFNHAILETLIKTLKNKNHQYEIIDLYDDKFNPAYDAIELSLFFSGKTADPLVSKYQEMIKKADHIVFIFPVWWNDLPAIVKGFIDKVMKKDFAYIFTANGLEGTLTYIKKVYIFTTASSTQWFIESYAGDAIKKTFMNATLKQIGINDSSWHHISFTEADTLEKRETFLTNIANIIE